MRTVPDTFTCPAHGTELKGLVEAELTQDPILMTNAWLGPGRRSKRLHPFLVIVTCPGGGGHEREIEGSWSP